MMVIFQNKIIYMPSVPPFSRSEKVRDYASQCLPFTWSEHDIKAADGTAIKILESGPNTVALQAQQRRRVVVLYLQGILRAWTGSKADDQQYTIVGLSYRGFWKSKGKASQPGIELDVEAALNWVLNRYEPQTKIIIWGQSIGAGAAAVGLANFLKSHPGSHNRISGLLLETPFVDLKTMLVALYPQKFLPYRYLAPFLRSTWDSKGALEDIGKIKSKLKMLIVEAGDDEIVPAGQGAILEQVCQEHGMEVDRATVPGALHTEVMMKPRGRSHIIRFLSSF
ncbi:uncharacterized protein A1O9_00220 [Exophiala aquamarina CBS 119918]|uniref:Serine aminopeptidase S33 domain-containing protein n=1 Tax=Exophiala aquamarina CBS 119918 TaxID=1182545 RepID=A0A072PSE4_9EURO|nr:uncharacterized protein A1O9_00220 [Exophiala aquamarina CBS 119918]KEF62248.1 hypothetical protein A1O9_00220 [Exophiala aquamarina CBS 119918]